MQVFRVYFLSAQSIIAAETIEASSPTEAATFGTSVAADSPWRRLNPDRLEVWQGDRFHQSAPLGFAQ
jgi:hypothetical protein